LDLAQRELVHEGRAALISCRDADSLDWALYVLIQVHDTQERPKLNRCYQIFLRSPNIDLCDPSATDRELDYHNLQAHGAYHDKVRAREEQ
jgi:hypothetical protein